MSIIIRLLFRILADVQKRLQEEEDPEQRDLIEKQYVLLKKLNVTIQFQFNDLKTFFSVLNIFEICKKELK